MSKQATIKAFIESTDLDRDAAFDQFTAEFGENFTRRGDFNHVWKLTKGTEGTVPKNTGTQVQAPAHDPNFELAVTTGRKEAIKIDPRIRIVMKTGTALDLMVSKRGGVQRGTVTMITGESGAGKTTICTNIATYLKEVAAETGATVTAGFISGEMDQNDWDEECLDNPSLLDLETVFLLDYLDTPHFMQALEAALGRWDFVVVDSFEAILDQIKEVTGWTAKKAESKFIELLRFVARDKAAALFVIQQYTKGGSYVGSTKIKHLTTAMSYVMFDGNGERYLVYVKNRRNGAMVGRRLYFTKNKETGRLEFDLARLETQLAVSNFTDGERAQLNKENSQFDDMFFNGNQSQHATESKAVHFVEAANHVGNTRTASVGDLQHTLRLDFNRAQGIMDELERAGIVGPAVGTEPREVLMSIDEIRDITEDVLITLDENREATENVA